MKLGRGFARGDVVLFKPHHLQGSCDAGGRPQPVEINDPSSSEGWIVGVIVGLPLEGDPHSAAAGSSQFVRDGEQPVSLLSTRQQRQPPNQHNHRRVWNRLLFRVSVVGRAGATIRDLTDTLRDMLLCVENEEVKVALDGASSTGLNTKGEQQPSSTAISKWSTEVRDRVVANIRREQCQDGADFDSAEYFLESSTTKHDGHNGEQALLPPAGMLALRRSLYTTPQPGEDVGTATVGVDDYCILLNSAALKRPSEVKIERSLMLWQILLPCLSRADILIKLQVSFARWREKTLAHAEDELRVRERLARAVQTQARRYSQRHTLADLRLHKAEAEDRAKWQRVHRDFSYIDGDKSRQNKHSTISNRRRYNVRGTKVLLPTLSSAKRWFDVMRTKIDRFVQITDTRHKYLYACVFELWKEMMIAQKRELQLMLQEEIYGS